ncbi:MAG: DUF47 domain-containing protein [Candidatus Thorarchaeota archaeon]|jgi:predicted phosphate transport protein (TIGR00153 family)
MGTFSRIFGGGDKGLQKKADELMLKLSKGLQSASAKLCVATECWEEGKFETLKELQEEIITLEREMDHVKEELVENVLTKSAFMPQAALERRTLVKALDKVIDATENPIRIMNMGCGMKPPGEIREIGKKLWKCTDLLQDAVKLLYTDFKKTIEITNKIDILREEARDTQFELLGKLYNNPDFKPTEIILFQSVSERMVHVAQKAEDAGDYIRELAVKYS